jgi:TPR repeat protein
LNCIICSCYQAHLLLAEHYRKKAGIDLESRPSSKSLSKEQRALTKLADENELQGAIGGYPQAYFDLAEGFSTGNGSQGLCFDKASAYYKIAFDSGYIAAADAYGYHLEQGAIGNCPDRINLEAALFWYMSGFLKKHSAATVHLGEAYGKINPGCQRFTHGLEWVQRNAPKSNLAFPLLSPFPTINILILSR